MLCGSNIIQEEMLPFLYALHDNQVVPQRSNYVIHHSDRHNKNVLHSVRIDNSYCFFPLIGSIVGIFQRPSNLNLSLV